MTDLHDRIAQLSPAKRQLLLQRIGAAEPQRTARPDTLPLAFAQRRLWFLWQLDPSAATYHIGRTLTFDGPLDVPALSAALDELVRRHEALRTHIAQVAGEPVQRIDPPFGVLAGVEDVAPERVADLAAAEVRRAFDLSSDHPFRARLWRIAPHRHVLALTIHHAFVDGWSFSILQRELATIYAAFHRGAPSPLVEPRVQYADCAVEEHAFLASPAADAQLAFWRHELAGAPLVLALPADFAPGNQPVRGGLRRRTLAPSLVRAARDLARAERVSTFVVHLAAFHVLLARLSGQDDFLIGTPLAHRASPERQGVVGFLANTVALRMRSAPTFRTLIAAAHAHVERALAHPDAPFEQVVQTLARGRSSVLQAFYAQWTHEAPRPFGDELVVRHDTVSDAALPAFDLSFLAEEGAGGSADGFVIEAEFAAHLFEPATIDRWLRQLEQLLAALVAQPDAPIASATALPDERAQLMALSGTTLERPAMTVDALFSAQAARTPTAIAIEHEGASLTYAALDQRSNQVAHQLCAMGVGPDHVVALYGERSLDLLVGLFGILKSGATYVPLDPAHPAERTAAIVGDAGAHILVTSHDVPGSLAHLTPLVLDDARLAHQPITSPARAASPDAVAFVIYTSGSTGRPKGVMIRHGALTNHALACCQYSAPDGRAIQPGDRLLQFAPFSFDVHAEESFPCLISGGTLVLRNEAMLASPDRFLRTCDAWRIDVINIPTAYWQEIVDAVKRGELALPARARRYVIGGERVPPERLVDWLAIAGPARPLINVYGPTETTVVSTFAELSRPAAREVSVGRPIPNVRAYVLDRTLALAALGAVGELYIGGDGLARGYLGRPDLTAERFVPDPFRDAAGARMYRTGDWVRWRSDGALEFHGRVDDQIKLRGFRIELAEVEAALRSHPAVRDAVAAVRGDDERRHLAAYWVGDAVAASELVGHVRQVLPDYMVPAAWLRIDALPLSPNGKVDRAALPAPSDDAPSAPYAAPKDAIEDVIAGIWADVLARDRVGVHDHFFELGGHSLLATRIVGRIRDAFQVELSLRTFFEAPTVAALAQRLAHERTACSPVPQVSRVGALPLSYSQERIWFLDQLHPGSGAYIVPHVLRLRGPLVVDAMSQALAAMAARHEALRTTFPATHGVPQQRIAPHGEIALDVAWVGAHALDERIHDETAGGFDLADGPLVRARLLRIDPTDAVLVIAMHHIVADGWAMALFERELFTLYASLVEARPSPLPAPRLQCVDLAVWERSQDGEASLAYWTNELAAVPTVLALPSDRPRPRTPSFRGDFRTRRLTPAALDAVRRLARREDATPFMVLLATFQLLLSRLSGQDQVLVGTATSGRAHTETEEIFGCFTNSLVLRGDLRGDPTFRTLLARVRAACVGAYARQDVPLERLVQAVQPERSQAHNPLFQVMFAHHPDAGPAAPAAGITREPREIRTGTTKLDLVLSTTERADGLDALLDYATDLFDADTADRMLGAFHVLLDAALAHPDARCSRLALLGPAELAERARGDQTVRATDSALVTSLFDAQVTRRPDAVALMFEQQCITYGELRARADRLAAQLRAAGVGPEVVVGVLVERSIERVVALLAVVRAGGAYVPLDPSYPADRLAYMVEDAGVRRIVSPRARAGHIPADDVDWIFVDDAPDATTRLARPALQPADLAYVIYTSGSTGRPKGVQVTHGGLTNLVQHAIAFYEIGATDRLGQLASFSFDASVFEVFVALCAGATLVLVPQRLVGSGADLHDWLAAQAVSALLITPSVLDVIPETNLPALRLVMTGGEVISPRTTARWAPGRRLVNVYGPTETTVISTVQDHASPGAFPIGRPIWNTTAHVLDRGLQPVPVGVPGDLYLGGAGLARGYRGRSALTADRFVPDPFSATPGARLYRTGDRAAVRRDGALDFLGRSDHQIKLRGHRIELGEIEAALRAHPDVGDAIATVRDSDGTRTLVAYVRPAASAIDGRALKHWLQQRIPPYMVPSAVVTLDALPRDANGKLDLRALPAPERIAQASEEVAPRNAVERAIAEAFADVLGLAAADLRVDHDFFELGGESLLATQVISRLRARLGFHLPLATIFEAPTIAGLARAVSDHEVVGAAAPQRTADAIPRQARDAASFPLSSAQQRMWLLEQFAEHAIYNVPTGFRITGVLDADALAAAFERLEQRHEALRTRFIAGDDEPCQTIVEARRPTIRRVDLRDLAPAAREAEAARIAIEELDRRFDLECDPPYRVTLLDLGHDEHLVWLVLHHIVYDGWSSAVLRRELFALYDEHTLGVASDLPALPVQGIDFAVWERDRLASGALAADLAYWRVTLADLPALALPFDHARPADDPHEGDGVLARVSAHDLRALEALARDEGCTLFMLLSSALKIMLCQHTGQRDIPIGTAVAGRPRRELEGVVGCFINTLVLRTDLSRDPTFREALRREREVALGAFQHPELPFQQLVHELQPQRDLTRPPLFQVFFALHHATHEAPQPRALVVQPWRVHAPTVTLDLVLEAIVSADGLRLELAYSSSVFDRSTAARMLEDLEAVLAHLCADPDHRIFAS